MVTELRSSSGTHLLSSVRCLQHRSAHVSLGDDSLRVECQAVRAFSACHVVLEQACAGAKVLSLPDGVVLYGGDTRCQKLELLLDFEPVATCGHLDAVVEHGCKGVCLQSPAGKKAEMSNEASSMPLCSCKLDAGVEPQNTAGTMLSATEISTINCASQLSSPVCLPIASQLTCRISHLVHWPKRPH